jgi:hypothetical protein
MTIALELSKFTKKIEKFLDSTVNKRQMTALGNFSIDLIVKRTRLGYGVNRDLGERSRLRGLKPSYIKYRQSQQRRGYLDSTTTANRSNLTLTGQMLRSMRVIRPEDGKISISPYGVRKDGKRNEKIAEYQAASGRVFNKLSLNEYNQLLRYYRKTFGDLLKKSSLLR